MNYFVSDLTLGKQAEVIVLKMIQFKYPEAHGTDGYLKEYDLVIPELEKTVEVKYDRMADRTGRYFFETECNGVPSGITATKADYWAHLDGQWLFWANTDTLRHYLKDNCGEPILYQGTRASSPKRGYLIRRGLILTSPYFKYPNLKVTWTTSVN